MYTVFLSCQTVFICNLQWACAMPLSVAAAGMIYHWTLTYGDTLVAGVVTCSVHLCCTASLLNILNLALVSYRYVQLIMWSLTQQAAVIYTTDVVNCWPNLPIHKGHIRLIYGKRRMANRIKTIEYILKREGLSKIWRGFITVYHNKTNGHKTQLT